MILPQLGDIEAQIKSLIFNDNEEKVCYLFMDIYNLRISFFRSNEVPSMRILPCQTPTKEPYGISSDHQFSPT